MTREEYGNAYQKGYDITVRFLISRGIPYDNAKETAQAAWARAWERLSQLRDPLQILTWMNSIALNLYRGHLRQGPVWVDLAPELLPSTLPVNGLNTAIAARQILALLKPKHRKILREYYIAGFSVLEIAQDAGLPETTIRIRLWRARRAAQELKPRVPSILDVVPTDCEKSQQGEIMSSDLRINLSPGMRILVAGNEVDQFRKTVGDRFTFWGISEIKRLMAAPAQTPPPVNLQSLVILQGKGMKTDYERAVREFCATNGVTDIKYAQHKAQLVQMFETVNSARHDASANGTTSNGDSRDIQATAQPQPVGTAQPAAESSEPSPDEQQPPPRRLTLNETLDKLEEFYDQFRGIPGRIIEHIRSLEFNDKVITDGCLRQRINKIRLRRGDPPAQRRYKVSASPQTADPALHALQSSTQGKALLDAASEMETAYERVLELAAAVAAENETLRAALAAKDAQLKTQDEQIKCFPDLLEQLAGQVATVRKSFEGKR